MFNLFGNKREKVSRKIPVSEYLPIGSVVILKDGEQELMICGRAQYNIQYNQTYDYFSCAYPHGYIGDDSNYLFNHEDIEKVIYKGYESKEDKEILEKIKEYLTSEGMEVY